MQRLLEVVQQQSRKWIYPKHNQDIGRAFRDGSFWCFHSSHCSDKINYSNYNTTRRGMTKDRFNHVTPHHIQPVKWNIDTSNSCRSLWFYKNYNLINKTEKSKQKTVLQCSRQWIPEYITYLRSTATFGCINLVGSTQTTMKQYTNTLLSTICV